ncbi:MAG TPA: acyltransferase [Verrucomicrobiae bacterium]|jgi:peptidoglycan/LPS O-acetylase OafA/YrhL|nr:acyltransferase [Verrucomicrobiae bacterium]
MASASKEEILPLTSLRFIAASLVFVEHVFAIPGLEWMHADRGWFGKIGVSIFFVLSGFVISWSYASQPWNGNFWNNAGDFYWSRVARIYPLHWLMFLVCLPLALRSLTAHVHLSGIPSLWTLTADLWPGFYAGPQPDRAAWTLSCEAFFYLTSPLLLLLLCSRRSPLVSAGVTLVTYLAIIWAVASLYGNLNWNAYLWEPDFILGVLGYFLFRRVDLSFLAGSMLIAGIALLVLSCLIEPRFNYNFARLVFGPGSLLVILGCARSKGLCKHLLSHPKLVLLGHSSYALYLFHDPLIRYSRIYFNRHGIVFGAGWNVLVALGFYVFACATSIACFKLYENPIRLKLRSLRKTKSSCGSDRTPIDTSKQSLPTAAIPGA